MNSSFNNEKIDKKIKEILEYCKTHTDKMWAAYIISILLDCDFRDSSSKLNDFFNKEK